MHINEPAIGWCKYNGFSTMLINTIDYELNSLENEFK